MYSHILSQKLLRFLKHKNIGLVPNKMTKDLPLLTKTYIDVLQRILITECILTELDWGECLGEVVCLK